MRIYPVSILLCLSAVLGYAQEPKSDQAMLGEVRGKYDAPFTRNLESFNCAVEFNWKQHFTEVVRLGDEGTDEEIKNFIQPIHTRVTVARQDVTASSGMSDDEINKLPHGGMAELLLEHAVEFSLRNWLTAANNGFIPQNGTPVHFEPSGSGYTLKLKVQSFDVEMALTKDMRLQSQSLKGSQPDRRETEFQPGPQGFLLSSFTQGEDGNFRVGNRIILTYTYQTVGGFQIPERVAVSRESHHENWHYRLTDCTVKTTQ